jgi:hypothetical protein
MKGFTLGRKSLKVIIEPLWAALIVLKPDIIVIIPLKKKKKKKKKETLTEK